MILNYKLENLFCYWRQLCYTAFFFMYHLVFSCMTAHANNHIPSRDAGTLYFVISVKISEVLRKETVLSTLYFLVILGVFGYKNVNSHRV